MTGRSHPWSVRLADAAERDFRDIYAWTADQFGADQAEVYADALSLTIDALRTGPRIIGAKMRDDVATGLCSLPVKVKRRRGRHHVFFRVAEQTREIVVLRILHDAMDPARHIGQ